MASFLSFVAVPSCANLDSLEFSSDEVDGPLLLSSLFAACRRMIYGRAIFKVAALPRASKLDLNRGGNKAIVHRRPLHCSRQARK